MIWTCPHCGKTIEKITPQGLGIAKSNHLRKHAVPLPPRPDYIDRDYDKYPRDLCHRMKGTCKNCPLPANMRGSCVEEDKKEKGYDTDNL